VKKIVIEISDETFEYLRGYSGQTGKSIEELAAEVVSSSLSILDFNKSEQKIKEEHEQWKRQRGFPFPIFPNTPDYGKMTAEEKWAFYEKTKAELIAKFAEDPK
jgi:hypothetical protein